MKILLKYKEFFLDVLKCYDIIKVIVIFGKGGKYGKR